MTRWRRRILKPLASLKLAVFIILALAVISIVGTIVEARYDATAAQKWVYHSKYMVVLMVLLSVNLIAVMVDRWPWKKQHTGFICAHVGIITLIVGAWITQKYGIDGSMTFEIGAGNRYVLLPETDLEVYASYGNGKFPRLHHQEVDFLVDDPKDTPVVFNVGKHKIEVLDYMPYALRDEKLTESDDRSLGAALRFQLFNENVNVTKWLQQWNKGRFEELNFGPAKIVIGPKGYQWQGGNELHFYVDKKTDQLRFTVYSKRKNGTIKSGKVQVGDVVDTGWMNLKIRFIKAYPYAKREVSFTALDRPTEVTTSAIKLRFDDKVEWLELNAPLRFYTDEALYLIRYGNRRMDIGFNMTLERFERGLYQGTMRAASYKSYMNVEGVGPVQIYMNNPLKHKGFTLYQASFSQNESGQPNASILSVNRDPGRWIKYLGSLMIVLGSIILFYFKRMKLRGKAKSRPPVESR